MPRDTPRVDVAAPVHMTEDNMTEDNLEQRTTDFMHALAASEADVANISAERTGRGMRVTFDLLDPNNADLVREVAKEHAADYLSSTAAELR